MLSIANLAYLLRKVLKGQALYQALNKLSKRLNISPMTQDSFEKALSLEASDFEDALQYYSALQTECEMIITRNKNDFQFSEIAVYSPDEFLAQSFPFSK
ncbi:PIN domain-containing protein [Bacteroides gallinaceum]|uniref:type II toxin-antitoxin system VapC family toxin n=1 Tax=Bacteroides gallinaceum TaxID=1462571 RepID=UPI0025A49385|nr:PIN domain-containing protein [Bacteroides gallinaceum]MDM8154758.1 PIN domain-containing protein [Bacteroides gallinaceum]